MIVGEWNQRDNLKQDYCALSTAPPPAWSPWCEGPSGGLGTGHGDGPPGFESEAASWLGRPGQTVGRPRSALACENPRRQKAWIQTWQETGWLGGKGRGAEKEKERVRNTDGKRRGQEKQRVTDSEVSRGCLGWWGEGPQEVGEKQKKKNIKKANKYMNNELILLCNKQVKKMN